MKMELIDTHAHLTFDEIENQIDAVLERSREAGINRWITVGTDLEQIERVLSLINRFDNIYAGLGFHPHYAKDVTDDNIISLKEHAQQDKVVAIGETGLDYYYDNSEPEAQKPVFRAHLNIASELNLPVIIHTRSSFDDTMDILSEYEGKLKDVVIHCYGGNAEQTQLILDRGYHISFTGIVTFKRCDELREVAKMVPLEKMMIETDCPYISPEPIRNQRPCEPAMLIHTARILAQLHNKLLEEFAEIVTETSKRFFNIKK